MKILKSALFISIVSFYSLIACKQNPHDNDPASTITPGNKLEVDSATAHSNNSFDTVKTKTGNNIDSTNSNNNNSGSNNINSGTKGNDNVKPAGTNSHINTNDDKRNPK